MDLGIEGKWALVCAASAGLGQGCARALAGEGVNLVITARRSTVLETTAADLRRACPDVEVRTAAGDITTAPGRHDALAACPQVDILVTNAGGTAPGELAQWTPADWLTALESHMLAPIELIRAVLGPMRQRRYGRIVNITSAAVKSAPAAFALGAGARAGLTAAVAGLARETVADNVTVNNLLPGSIRTARLQALAAVEAGSSGRSAADALALRESRHPARRFGTVEEFGAACAFLCSVQAGYITGQNLVIDGGAYVGTF